MAIVLFREVQGLLVCGFEVKSETMYFVIQDRYHFFQMFVELMLINVPVIFYKI